MTQPKYIRKFVGFFPGQAALMEAEVKRRGVSIGVVAREIFEIGIPKYRKIYKLPPTYPDNGLGDFKK